MFPYQPYQYGAMLQNQNAYEQSLKNIIDQANNQLQQLQNQNASQQAAMQAIPTNLTQNFQLANNNTQSNLKFVNNIDDVQKEIVLIDTYFLTNDMSTLWIKNPKGDIRTFKLKEIIQKDEKDNLIDNLQKQVNELKEVINNANEQSDVSSTNDESTSTEKSSSIQSITTGSAAKRKSK